ncbi:MAG: hypothetical protein IJ597_07210, partial [Synergistaceae bacterium]|nr:hypothetical protein [Synergistaceae bacterium]
WNGIPLENAHSKGDSSLMTISFKNGRFPHGWLCRHGNGVKGHADNELNNRCDELVQKARKELK